MVGLSAAFDASGDKSTAVLAVAGFLSSESDWRAFSEQWSKRLAQDEIKFFRAVDASGFQGPFEHWQQREDKVQLRESLFRDLMGILHSHAYRRFGCIVINQAFDTLSEELRKEFRLCANSLAGLNCKKQVRQHLLKNG